MVKAPLEGLSPVSVNVRLLPGVWRRPHLLSFSDQGVYSRCQLQEQTVSVCPLTFPYCLSSDSWPISRQNSMRSSCSPSQGRQPTLTAFLHSPSYTTLPKNSPLLHSSHVSHPTMSSWSQQGHSPVTARWLLILVPHDAHISVQALQGNVIHTRCSNCPEKVWEVSP